MRGTIVVVTLVALASACTSSPSSVGSADHSTPAVAVERVTLEGMWTHLEALQRIADEHGGTRVVGSAGYEASVAYAVGVLEGAGYRVQTRAVDVPAFEQRAPTVLERVSPSHRVWRDGVDLRAMLFSASGDVRARATEATGGCDAANLAGFPTGDVALFAPGPCLRREQVLNAQRAGASAAIVAYPGTTAGRPVRPTLLSPDGIEIPAVSVTPEVGAALAAAGDGATTVHLRVDASSRWVQADNVIAGSPGDTGARVVMLGAHLDSVMDGPGINDDGSGVAVLLEVARWLASREADAGVRFGLWAGEEQGLYGSRAYVADLSDVEARDIDAYLNLDMAASPNFVRYVVADRPATASAAETTRRIRDLFTEHFGDRRLAVETIDLQGGSDHGPFAQVGIPVGGLFSGASEVKTSEQGDAYGGDVGEPMDACYHQPCDTLRNVSGTAIEQLAAAYVAVLSELAGVS